MRTRIPLILLLLALPGLIAGCGRTTPGAPTGENASTSLDQAAVASVLTGLPEVVEDGQFEAADTAAVGDDLATAGAVSDRARFWRVITGRQRSFAFEFGDVDSTGRPTTATVVVRTLLTGRFNVLRRTTTGDGAAADSFYVVRKPLTDHRVRRVLLKRVGAEDSTSRWRVVAASGVRITAENATSRVLSLRIQAAQLDTTITDPLAFFRLRRVLAFQPGEPVTLTVTTGHDDDVVVLCRVGHRLRFRSQGGGVYTATWRAPGRNTEDVRAGGPPLFHFGVNALTHGTLYDDAAPYDSQAWVLPFVLAPDRLAEALP